MNKHLIDFLINRNRSVHPSRQYNRIRHRRPFPWGCIVDRT
jgi:hypothetical protein